MKKKMGRPKKAPADKLQVVSARFTKSQLEMLQTAANLTNTTVTQLIRQAAMEKVDNYILMAEHNVIADFTPLLKKNRKALA